MHTVDKNISKRFIPKAKFFVAAEVFYDSVIKKFNRNHLTIGITKTLTKQVSADIYFMKQNDGCAHPGDLNAVWTTLKIHL